MTGLPLRGDVLLSGASGLIGSRLLRSLAGEGVAVRALTRDPTAARPLAAPSRWVGWDGTHFAAQAVAGASAVVHLAGEPVMGGRLTPARRARILASRVDSTRSLVETLAGLPDAQRPRVLVCASAVGYYGSRGEQALDEDAPPGTGFLAGVCRAWEDAANAVRPFGVRCVTLRIGIVLAREGGALAGLLPVFRLGLGGRLGDGRQWFPWIHANDVTKLIAFALRDEALAGPVNAVAPEPVRNLAWTRALARALRRPALLPVPAFALRAALGELAGELLDSRRCEPRRAVARGFAFEHARVESALAAELHPR